MMPFLSWVTQGFLKCTLRPGKRGEVSSKRFEACSLLYSKTASLSGFLAANACFVVDVSYYRGDHLLV